MQALPLSGFLSVLVLGSLLVAFGWGSVLGVLWLAAGLVFLAWRFPRLVFWMMLASLPLIGWLIAVPTISLNLSRGFGGTLEIGVGEILGFLLAVSWLGCRLWLHFKHAPASEKIIRPYFVPYAVLVLAQLLSMFSRAAPDPIVVFKFALRPVAFAYLLCILLPAYFIRSRSRLLEALGVLTGVGTFFAFDGLRSLFLVGVQEAGFHRARPLLIFGVNALGGNHNSLGELLVMTIPLALAFGWMARAVRVRAAAFLSAGLMTVIALLTFSRSVWIALICQFALLTATVWRPWVKRQRDMLIWLGVLCVPVIGLMVYVSFSPAVQSSTDARLALADIAWNFFRSDPLLGVGAGTFPDRLANVWSFVVDYGNPLDAHGMVQKIAAETGLLGLAAFAFVLLSVVRDMLRTDRYIKTHPDERLIYVLICTSAFGALLYQLFSTSLWTARLWLPVGLTAAAGQVFLARQLRRDPNLLPPA